MIDDMLINRKNMKRGLRTTADNHHRDDGGVSALHVRPTASSSSSPQEQQQPLPVPTQALDAFRKLLEDHLRVICRDPLIVRNAPAYYGILADRLHDSLDDVAALVKARKNE